MRKSCCLFLLLIATLLKMSVFAAADESRLLLDVYLPDGVITLQDGDDPCDEIRNHCSERQRSDCFYEAHSKTLDTIVAKWEDVYTKLRILPELFVDCELLFEDGLEDTSACTLQPPPVYALIQSVPGVNTTKQVVSEVLSLLHRSVLGEEEALALYDKLKYELKLSDEERLSLYSQAIVINPRLPFVVDQLALALIYTGREEKGRRLYENAVRQGMWPHVLQRPVESYYPGLAPRPWHDKKEHPFLLQLEQAYLDIKQELLHNLKENKHLFGLEGENMNTPKGGEWKELRLKSFDNYTSAQEFFPITVDLLKNSGQHILNAKFSSIKPGTHIRLHTGPSNKSLRCHFTLVHEGGAQIRVGNEWATWEEGKTILFDSSWEHEVIHNGDSVRVVLIVDIWNPELPQEMRVSSKHIS